MTSDGILHVFQRGYATDAIDQRPGGPGARCFSRPRRRHRRGRGRSPWCRDDRPASARSRWPSDPAADFPADESAGRRAPRHTRVGGAARNHRRPTPEPDRASGPAGPESAAAACCNWPAWPAPRSAGHPPARPTPGRSPATCHAAAALSVSRPARRTSACDIDRCRRRIEESAHPQSDQHRFTRDRGVIELPLISTVDPARTAAT